MLRKNQMSLGINEPKTVPEQFRLLAA